MEIEKLNKSDYYTMYVLMYQKYLKEENIVNFEFSTDPTNSRNKNFIRIIKNEKNIEMRCYISGCELIRRFETDYFIKNYLHFSDLILLLQETTGIIITYNRSELSEMNLNWGK